MSLDTHEAFVPGGRLVCCALTPSSFSLGCTWVSLLAEPLSVLRGIRVAFVRPLVCNVGLARRLCGSPGICGGPTGSGGAGSSQNSPALESKLVNHCGSSFSSLCLHYRGTLGGASGALRTFHGFSVRAWGHLLGLWRLCWRVLGCHPPLPHPSAEGPWGAFGNRSSPSQAQCFLKSQLLPLGQQVPGKASNGLTVVQATHCLANPGLRENGYGDRQGREPLQTFPQLLRARVGGQAVPQLLYDLEH